MLSDSIKEEEEAYPMADQDPEEVKNFHRPAAEEFTIAMTSDRIKEEGEDYPVTDENQGEVINVHIPFGEELSIATISEGIKEDDTFPMVDRDPEEVKNIHSCANVPVPDAAESGKGGNDESQPQSDSDTSESIIQAPTRRRARVLPLPEFSPDSDELQEEVPTPPSEGRRTNRQQSLFQRQSNPLRRRREEGRRCTEEGEGPSLFGGLEVSMLKVQRLQCKLMRSMNRQLVFIDHNMGSTHRQLVSLNNNMCKLHEGQQATAEHVREMTNAIKELCTVMQQGHVTHRRRHHQLMGRLDGFSRSINQLTTTTALVSQRAVGMQVEVAHCSRDIAQGLVQVTNVLETMQTARSSTNSDMGGGHSEELSSLSSVTAPVMDPRHRSSRHSTVSEPATRGATEPTERSSRVRGRKK